MEQETLVEQLWSQFTAYWGRLDYEQVITNIVFSVALIILARIVIFFGKKLLDRALTPPEDEDKFFIDAKLAQTLRALFKTLLNYGVSLATALIILHIFHIDIIQLEDIKAFGGKLIQAIIIVAIARAFLRIGEVAIKHVFFPEEDEKPIIEEKRAKTLSALLLSIMRYLVYFIAGIMVLQTFGVQTSSILASAGIAGLAVGFGAQNLVKDFISGFFIIFEDQFSVGDYVTVAGITGVVEELGLRSTRIREWTGHLHTIPNGEITKVKNYNRGAILALVTVGIAYEEDIDKAIEVMRQTCEKVYKERDDILEVPVVLGVEALSDSSVDVLVTANTKPGRQWAVQRELRKRFKQDLETAGIEIPFPRRVVYHRTEGEGKRMVIETE